MLFNSYEFIFLFLPFTFFIYFYLSKKRFTEVAKGFLVLSSLFLNVIYLPLILGSIVFNYCFGVKLNKENSKKIYSYTGHRGKFDAAWIF